MIGFWSPSAGPCSLWEIRLPSNFPSSSTWNRDAGPPLLGSFSTNLAVSAGTRSVLRHSGPNLRATIRGLRSLLALRLFLGSFGGQVPPHLPGSPPVLPFLRSTPAHLLFSLPQLTVASLKPGAPLLDFISLLTRCVCSSYPLALGFMWRSRLCCQLRGRIWSIRRLNSCRLLL